MQYPSNSWTARKPLGRYCPRQEGLERGRHQHSAIQGYVLVEATSHRHRQELNIFFREDIDYLAAIRRLMPPIAGLFLEFPADILQSLKRDCPGILVIFGPARQGPQVFVWRHGYEWGNR